MTNYSLLYTFQWKDIEYFYDECIRIYPFLTILQTMTYRQGETVNHLALVTTKPFSIDSDCMDPRLHFFLVYFFEATSGVTWWSRALTGGHALSMKFWLQNSRKQMGLSHRAWKTKQLSYEKHGLEMNRSKLLMVFRWSRDTVIKILIKIPILEH